MARPSTGTNLTIAQLQQIMDQRRSELQRLYKQRGELEKKLGALDRLIGKIEGGDGVSPRRGRGAGSGGAGTRVRNDKSLPDVMEEVIRANGGPMRVPDIADAVLKTGYRSNSANFKGIVNQQLIKDKRFGQAERGVYQLKK